MYIDEYVEDGVRYYGVFDLKHNHLFSSQSIEDCWQFQRDWEESNWQQL